MSDPGGDIYWRVPEDGGTPRDPARLIASGPSEFLVRACAEEGTSILQHAVSRVDLICCNREARPVTVTLRLDLSGDGRRTDRDETLWGGMTWRDFVFIKPSGQGWRQISGQVQGWVCTVRFTAASGETQIGLSPWYTYGDYLRFVNSLPPHPHLQQRLAGHSDRGREHWELTVTDPSAPAQHKRRIFWHAREHAYETFSSFAMEGAVAYLLSDKAAEARRRFEVVLHPMSNVDGVAEGYEYRGGYDAPEEPAAKSAQFTWATIKRLRPDFIITWHNWIAPRDEDTLFYTDEEEGQPARRAWDLFTQCFPSPRQVGHRWHAEEEPLRENWWGRAMADETNVHQYAAKHYGSRVWGWEMPWWNRTPAEARHAGAAFVRAFLATIAIIDAGHPASGAKAAGAGNV